MLKTVDIVKVEVIGSKGTKTYFIDRSMFILGRQDGCDIKIDDPNISREHLKITLSEEQGIILEDLGSSNGTFINTQRIPPRVFVPVTEKDSISFVKSDFRVKLSLVKMDKEVKFDADDLARQAEENPIHIQMTGYAQNENELKLDFKNVGLDMAKYLTPAEQAQGIIKEAEFLSQSLLKAAEAQQQKVVNETRLEAKKISDETYAEYRKRVDALLREAKSAVTEVKAKNEAFIQDRKKEAFTEITQQWQTHEKAIEDSKSQIMQKFEEDNARKVDLEIEKLRIEQMVAKEKLISEADTEIQRKIEKQRKDLADEMHEHQND